MPRLAASSGGVVSIPALPGRRKLAFITSASTVFWGWEPDITGNLGDANCGIPLAANSLVIFGDADADQAMPVYFITSSGGAVIYYSGR